MLKLRSFQVGLFSNMISFDSKIDYASKITAASDGIFNGEPAILPIPNNAPPEIPRIVVKSKDGKYVCNTSINRVDLFFNPKNDAEANITNLKNDYLSLLVKVINFLNETYKFKIFRMGIVGNVIIELKESANTFIVSRYLKESNLISNTYEAQLHFLNKIELLKRYKANRWLRIHTVRKREELENDKFLGVTVDINTLQDVSYDFDRELVSLIFNDAIKNMQELLDAHYKGV
ncbi:MAG: hypothetical protein PHI58_01350 [Candidatus Omnitrophica bacterium]|nr:hypothetical protein [Candidatus Omnitrophota bacterium]